MQAERLGNAQAGAVEERQHGRVAGQDPGLPVASPARVPVSVTATADAAESGRGRFFSTLGVRIAAKAEAVPCPSRSRWRAKERKRRELAHQGAALHGLAAPGRQEGADVQRLQGKNRATAGGSPRWAVRKARNWRRSRP